ncbi:UNVERIFIED_CONTAM: MoaA/NifB/PqqE/SkfB family radical SAM enzyme [Acetivibrio alkalicellulosi]
MKFPFEIHFEIERNCELRCKHCSSHLIRDQVKRKYTFLDIAQLIQLLNKYSVYVFFTGGEPLLSKDISELIQHVSIQPIDTHVGLFTSGITSNKEGNLESITNERARKMHSIGLEMCYVSVYSYDSVIHDSMTNIQSSHLLTNNAMKNLLKEGIDVKFNSVIYSDNENDIDGILEYANFIGASEVRLLKLIQHGNAKKNWDELCLTHNKHCNILINYLNRQNFFPQITISGYPQIAPCRPFDSSRGCEAGVRLLYITYLGDVFPCACTKNNPYYKICHISDVDKLKKYLYNINSTYRLCCLSTKEGYV